MTLKEARERVGKTQQEMASLLGVTRNYLALIETGKRKEPPDLLERALVIVNKAAKDLTLEDWKSRALTAESKLASLKSVMQTWIESI